MKKKSKLL